MTVDCHWSDYRYVLQGKYIQQNTFGGHDRFILYEGRMSSLLKYSLVFAVFVSRFTAFSDVNLVLHIVTHFFRKFLFIHRPRVLVGKH